MNTKRKEALNRIKIMMDKGYYRGFELKPRKKIWFCITHNVLDNERDCARRISNGEKVKGRGGRDVKLIFGYGYLLGINYVKGSTTPKGTGQFSQYILYDVTILKGGNESYHIYHVYHEYWIKFGQWVKENLTFKEKMVFT